MYFTKVAIIPAILAVSEMDFLGGAEKFGAMTFLCIYLLWMSYRDRRDIVERLRASEDKQVEIAERGRQDSMIREARAYDVINRLSKALEGCECLSLQERKKIVEKQNGESHELPRMGKRGEAANDG